jgi:hypothetical protein
MSTGQRRDLPPFLFGKAPAVCRTRGGALSGGRGAAGLRAGIEGGVQQGLPPQTGRHMISEMLTASSEVGVLNP